MRFATRTTALLGIAALACEASSAPPELGASRAPIIHGDASTADQDATIRLDADGMFQCSGVLVAPNVVVTARHCVALFDAIGGCGRVTGDRPASAFSIALGPSAAPLPVRGRRLFVPTSPDLCGADIALLVLEAEGGALPIAIPSFRVPASGERTVAVGYGKDEHGVVPPSRRQRDVLITAVGPTSSTYRTDAGVDLPFAVPAGEVAGSESTCIGDSGGPLLDRDGLLVGITSRGIDDACVDRPTLFTLLAGHEALFTEALAFAATSSLDGSTGDAPRPDASSGDAPTGLDASAITLRASGASCTIGPARRGTPPAAFALLLVVVVATFRRKRLRGWG